MATVKTSNKGRIISRLILASAMFTLGAGLTPMADAQGVTTSMQEMGANQHHSDDSLQGTWLFDINVSGLPTFHSLISFTSGGVVVTTASLPGPAVSPFYGSWRDAGRNRFQATFYSFLPDAAGIGVALSKVSLKLQLTSRDTLTGTGVGANCDLQAENCIPNVDHKFTGKRILP